MLCLRTDRSGSVIWERAGQEGDDYVVSGLMGQGKRGYFLTGGSLPAMHALIAISFREEKVSPRRRMLRKKVKSEDVDDRIVLLVTLVSASDALKDH